MAFPQKPNSGNVWAQVAFYLSLGFIIPGAVVRGGLLGWFLDHHLHTSPIFITGGIGRCVGGIVETPPDFEPDSKRADRDNKSGSAGKR